jgi:hypothetical protein
MKGYRSTIEKCELSDNLIHKVQITTDEEKLFLIVDYMDGRFVIERNFKNNIMGIERMSQERDKFNTEEKIIQYLGIGDQK